MEYRIIPSTPGVYRLQDRDGNDLAMIIPLGSAPHQQSVIDVLQLGLEGINDGLSRDWIARHMRPAVVK